MGHAFVLGGLGSGAVIGLMLLSLVFGAVFLRLSFWIFERCTPSFSMALVAMFVSFALLVLTDFVLGLALSPVPKLGMPVIWTTDLAVMFWVVQQMLRLPSGKTLSYGRAGLVTLGSFFLELLLVGLAWLVIHYNSVLR